MSAQNNVNSPEKYFLYDEMLSGFLSSVCGFSPVVSGFSIGFSPFSIRPSKKVFPFAANARGHFTTKPSGDTHSRIFPA